MNHIIVGSGSTAGMFSGVAGSGSVVLLSSSMVGSGSKVERSSGDRKISWIFVRCGWKGFHPQSFHYVEPYLLQQGCHYVLEAPQPRHVPD